MQSPGLSRSDAIMRQNPLLTQRVFFAAPSHQAGAELTRDAPKRRFVVIKLQKILLVITISGKTLDSGLLPFRMTW